LRVMGVDPGLETTGYGIVEISGCSLKLVEAGTVRTRASDPIEERLADLYKGLTEVISECRPQCLAVEKLYSKFAHPMTAVKMAHARGVILLASAQLGVKAYSYPATRIKKALTGSGHATKQQVQRMVASALRLDRLPTPVDVADALAAAICHSHCVSRNI